MSVIKVECTGGAAYVLDEWGNVWQLVCVHPDYPEIRRLTRLDREATNRIVEPQLERFAR
jgi:hypothetical protein